MSAVCLKSSTRETRPEDLGKYRPSLDTPQRRHAGDLLCSSANDPTRTWPLRVDSVELGRELTFGARKIIVCLLLEPDIGR